MLWYLESTYRDIFQTYTVAKTPATFHNPVMETITTNASSEHPKTDGKTTYLKKNNIDEDIHQKMMKKDVY